MIIFIYGTTGELIKILPLIKRIPKDQQIRISTEQQPHQLAGLQAETGAPEPDLKLTNGRHGHDLEKISDMFFWLKDFIFNYYKMRRLIKKAVKANGRKQTMVIVHGDTMTTVLGALAGRLNRLKVAHIESGLRSGNWRHPFPEELDRRMVSKIARIHFAPGSVPIANLKEAGVKGQVVDTKLNTVLDSLRLAQASTVKIEGLNKLPPKFFVVSIHRNELLAQPKELADILKKIAAKAVDVPCIFLDHPITKETIRAKKLDNILAVPHLTRIKKLRYYQFISLASKADFIVTDSGGLQEESAYLGIPCLVHRLTTEREEGLGQNVVLSKYDHTIASEFMGDPYKYRRPPISQTLSPTQIIFDYLVEHGYVSL